MPNIYTNEEVVLCAFIALYDKGLLNTRKITSLTGRSETSIKLKVQNIAAMLDYKGIARNQSVAALTGQVRGEIGRETDWGVVEPLLQIGKDAHWKRCKEILIS